MNYDANTLEQALIEQAVQATKAALLPTVSERLQETQKALAKTQEQLQQAAAGLQAKDEILVAVTKERDAARTEVEQLRPTPPAPTPDAPAEGSTAD